VEVVTALRFGDGRDVAVLPPGMLAGGVGLEHLAARHPILILGALGLVLLLCTICAEGQLDLEYLAHEGLGSTQPPHHVGDTEAAAEAAGLVAKRVIPGPFEPGLGIAGLDGVCREGKARAVVRQSAALEQARLAVKVLRGLHEEIGIAVVGEAGPDLEPHPLVEEALALDPELRREVVSQQWQLLHREGRTLLEAHCGRVFAQRPTLEPLHGLAGVRGR